VRIVPLGLALLALGGCVRPIPYFSRNLCVKDAVAVTSSWDGQLRRVFDKLWAVAAADAPSHDVVVVAVDGPSTLRTAWTCGNEQRNTIAFSTRALGRLNTWPDAETPVAITVAHELAHVVLHQGRSAGATTTRDEIEADTLGVFYFERAGYDCRRWIERQGVAYTEGYAPPEARRLLAETACADAKRGVRPRV
jgi:hypothetical protein